MHQKSVKINYVLNTAYQILVLIVPLITTPYISRTLGANGIGIYSYTYAIISYFMLFAVMETSTYAQRTIAYYKSDKIQRSVKFFEILSIRIITTFICVGAYIGSGAHTREEYLNIESVPVGLKIVAELILENFV